MTAVTLPSSPQPVLAAAIGIDWASDHHDIALQPLQPPGPVEESRLVHRPDVLRQWLAALEQRFGGQPIGITVATSRGPLVHALLEAPFVVLYPVNPRSLRRFRETFSPNGAKDDAPDARLLLALLVQHRARLVAWRPDDPRTRLLRQLVEQRRSAIALRTQRVQQLQTVLAGYFPQALAWTGEALASDMACAFLERWPTLSAVRRARPSTVRRFYLQHRCRRPAVIAARLTEIEQSVPLTTDAAVLTSGPLMVRLLVRQLVALRPSIAALDAAIADHFAAHADAPIFRSFPGAGAALAPRRLVAFGTDRTRFSRPPRFNNTAGLRRSRSRAVARDRCTGAGPPRRFCARPFTSLRSIRFTTARGRRRTTRNNAAAARPITAPCERWRSSGFASSGGAGTIAPPTMQRAITMRLRVSSHHSFTFSQPPMLPNPLDRSPQMALRLRRFFRNSLKAQMYGLTTGRA